MPNAARCSQTGPVQRGGAACRALRYRPATRTTRAGWAPAGAPPSSCSAVAETDGEVEIVLQQVCDRIAQYQREGDLRILRVELVEPAAQDVAAEVGRRGNPQLAADYAVAGQQRGVAIVERAQRLLA